MESKPEKWCSKGHGTVVEDAKGKWWMGDGKVTFKNFKYEPIK